MNFLIKIKKLSIIDKFFISAAKKGGVFNQLKINKL